MIEERKKYAKRILDVKDWESKGGTTSLPSFMHNSEKSQYRFIPQKNVSLTQLFPNKSVIICKRLRDDAYVDFKKIGCRNKNGCKKTR